MEQPGPFEDAFELRAGVEHAGQTHDVWEPRGGGAPGKPVILLHEMDGFGAPVQALAGLLAGQGFDVHLPVFEKPLRMCVGSEFACMLSGRSSRVADWVRGLAAEVAAGRKVGVVGMCFTGGIALATVTEPAVAAAVAAQPAVPFRAKYPRRWARHLGLSEGERSEVAGALASGKKVLPVRFERDFVCPAGRVEEIASLPGAEPVHWVAGRGHPTLTYLFRPKSRLTTSAKHAARQSASEDAIGAVVGFLGDHL